MSRKIVIYFFAIILSLGGIFYFLNFFSIVNFSSLAKNKVIQIFKGEKENQIIYQNQDLFLLKENQNKKLLESINQQKTDLEVKEKELKEKEISLKQSELEIEEQKKNLELEKQFIVQEKKEKENYQVNVQKIANQFLNMPPERAVERLVALNDDILIIDILKKIDEMAQAEGAISIVAYFYSLMPQEDAARIIRKSSIVF